MRPLLRFPAFLGFCLLATVAFGQMNAPPTTGAGQPPDFGNLGFPGLETAATPAQPTVPTEPTEPEIDIAEAAGTLTNPTAFIYLSQEYVFNLLVLANSLGIAGVEFDPDALPSIQPPREEEEDLDTEWVGGSTRRGRRTLESAQYMSGTGETSRAEIGEEEFAGWLDAVSASGNEPLAKLLELVEPLPEWRRVGRFPVLTTEKKEIEDEITNVYAQAFTLGVPQYQAYGGYYGEGSYQSGYYDDQGRWVEPGQQWAAPAPGAAPPGQPGQPGQPAQQGPPPIDPQAMGRWYCFYQQMIAWERYVSEEILLFDENENAGVYELDTALQPQDLYLVPQPENAPEPVIHFDESEETEVTQFLSVVRPGSAEPALDQMRRVMEEWAEKRAEEDSEKSRAFVARLNARKERRYRYREWLNDRATEIRELAEDYQRRLDGDTFSLEGVEILVTQEPLRNVPLNSINVVTKNLTPYDLLENDGSLRRPSEEAID